MLLAGRDRSLGREHISPSRSRERHARASTS